MITQVVADLGAAGRRSASWEMPAGSSAAEPRPSLAAGMPNTISPPTPAADRLGGRLAQAVPGVLDHAGHRADRLRLADALP